MDIYETSKISTKRYKKIKKLLKLVYDYDTFKPKQYEIINRILHGEDVCAVLPTGYGKSLTFQIPALYLDKPAIIITPLLSLMNDQKLILEKLGISSCCLNSTVADKSKMKKEILQAKYQFIYIAPEMVIYMEDLLIQLDKGKGISLIAIDEAHCISAYGFSFRESYRKLSFFKQILPDVPILAVTATATNQVSEDICKNLGFSHHSPIKTSFDRPNLYLEIRQKTKEIGRDIVSIIQKHQNESIIIYCLTRKETSKIKDILSTYNIKANNYHAHLSSDEKEKAHHEFLNDKVKIIVATIAFGMGINKSNVRAVIHYGCPKNIEGYYQEIGRAGRDGQKAFCYTFYNERDFKIQESFIVSGNNESYQKTQLKLLNQMKKYAHTKNCRRQLLLQYFDENMEKSCQYCDNCLGVKKEEPKIIKVKQDVEKEAKILIEMIESIKDRSFGVTMYINILRGSNNKSVFANLRKNIYYGAGKHRSVNWWKELFQNLIDMKFLQQSYLKSGHFPMQIVKVTSRGSQWANMSDLKDVLSDLDIANLGPIEMATEI